MRKGGKKRGGRKTECGAELPGRPSSPVERSPKSALGQKKKKGKKKKKKKTGGGGDLLVMFDPPRVTKRKGKEKREEGEKNRRGQIRVDRAKKKKIFLGKIHGRDTEKKKKREKKKKKNSKMRKLDISFSALPCEPIN